MELRKRVREQYGTISTFGQGMRLTMRAAELLRGERVTPKTVQGRRSFTGDCQKSECRSHIKGSVVVGSEGSQGSRLGLLDSITVWL